jgi:hypothetical protein
MANATVVDEVGAKLCGQASFSTPTSKWTLLIFAIAESLLLNWYG